VADDRFNRWAGGRPAIAPTTSGSLVAGRRCDRVYSRTIVSEGGAGLSERAETDVSPTPHGRWSETICFCNG
jgi:hypothetical protein